MVHSTITTKGQTTIPVDIRSFLGVGPGDGLEYVKTKSGKVEITPRKRFVSSELFGILPKPKKCLTIKQMNEAIGRAVAAKYERSLPKRRKK